MRGIRRQCGKQVQQSKGIVQVPQSVDEAGVSLADEVVQGVHGSELFQAVGLLLVALRLGLLHLLLVRPDVAEGIEQGLVQEEIDVLDVVVTA